MNRVAHQVSYRKLSSDEAHRVKRAGLVGAERWIDDFVILPILAFGGFFIIGMLVAAFTVWGLQTFGLGHTEMAVGGILGIASVYGLFASARVVRNARRASRRGRRDLRRQQVEVVRVDGARLVEQEERNDEGPLYYFDVGDGLVLFLGGQWLLDPETYGLKVDDHEAEDLEENLPFPASTFVVHRLPSSGHVLRLEASGSRLSPEAVLPYHATIPDWLTSERDQSWAGQSLMIPGDFDELAAGPAASMDNQHRPQKR